jgi:hypothetical protein
MVTAHPNILGSAEIQTLQDYLDSDDDRTDHRPDVRSKHPRWDIDAWPQQVVADALDKIYQSAYQVEEVTFQDTRIGLRPHTDNSSLAGTRGLTVMLCLDAEPEAHTVFFDNYLLGWYGSGVFFTRQPWSPFQYSIPGRSGELIYVKDIRDLLTACEQDPAAVSQFDVTDDFLAELRDTVRKRGLARMEYNSQTLDTGFVQPGPRQNDYTKLTNYDPDLQFDPDMHQRYLSHVAIEDLQGLTLDTVVTWQPGLLIQFDREQLHASSGCHTRKKFITIFCHQV